MSQVCEATTDIEAEEGTLNTAAQQGEMKTFRLAIWLVIAHCGGRAFAANSGWYDAAWTNRKAISINATNVAGPLTNFPVLLNQKDTDLQNRSLANGNDLVFTASDGTTKLAHEIESYSNGTLVAWVNVPYLPSTTNTELYLYYGNPTAANQQNAAGVWDANFSTVWHLKEAGGGNSSEFKDATSNARHARGRGGIPGVTAGKFGNGQLFNGTSDYIEGESNLGITGNSARTLSFWVKLTTATGSAIAGWGNANNNENFIAGAYANTWTLAGNGTGNDWTGIAAASTGSWQLHTVVHNGSTARWYVDGVEIGSGFNHTYATKDGKVLLGQATYAGNVYYLNGTLDEVRLSNLARSTNWIRTEFANQNSPATFYTVGAEEAPATKANSALTLSASANPVATGTNVVLTVVASAVAPATGTPGGTVQFRSDGAALGSAVALAGGLARLTNAALTHGSHVITAEYGGDANFLGNTNRLDAVLVVDTAPNAGADALRRYPGGGVKVRTASLLTNDYDPDGDAISLLAIDSQTKNGGIISSNSGWLIYSPASGDTNSDSFSYVIAGSGGLPATGVVAIAVEPTAGDPLDLAGSELPPRGEPQLRLRGIPGRTYHIEFAPKRDALIWQSLTTLTATSRGELDFSDPTGTNAATCFYRATIP